MALVLADRVRETTTVVGTGTATLLGAVTGYQSFTAVGNANTTYYVIASQAANQWEVGIGTYTASGTTLSRDTVLSSSNAGALVNFTAGTKDIWVDYAAGRAVYENEAGNVDGFPITGGSINNTVIGNTTPNAATFTTLTATGQTSLGGAAGAETVRVNTGTNTGKYTLFEANTANNVQLIGAPNSANLGLYSTGGGLVRFYTAAALQEQQFAIGRTASAVNFVQVTGNTTSNTPIISAQGSDANIGLAYITKGTGSHFLYGPSLPAFQVNSQAANANYGIFTSTSTGISPLLQVAGTDANIDFRFRTQGTGLYQFDTGSNANTQFRVASTVSAVNYVQVTGAATGSGAVISTQGSDTNVNLLVNPKGTGNVGIGTGAVQPSAPLEVRRDQNATTEISLYNATSVTAPTVNVRYMLRNSTSGGPTGGGAYLGLQSNNLRLWNEFGNSIIVATNGTQMFRFLSNASVVNNFDVQGAATTQTPVFSVSGSDTNIAQVFQSKGTGAINLAPGSSGVNISNGGTVTAITRTAAGSAYTTIPALAISAPTTAGGVQATAAVTAMVVNTVAVSSGGTGYTAGDVLTVSDGTVAPAQLSTQVTVSTVSAGVITAVTVSRFGTYSVLPTNPASVTGGTGSGATFNFTYAISGASTNFTITNAGSGYVEQPTVTFSGGGGSGAAAYASVGSGTIIRSLGGSGNAAQSMSFVTPSGESFRVATSTTGNTSANYLQAASGSTGNGVSLSSQGSDSNIWMILATKGTGNIQLLTNAGQEQLRVAHTASAVNYVQVTGSATGGNGPVISSQGSDANVNATIQTKGSGVFRVVANNAEQFRVNAVGSAANIIQVSGAASGSAPSVRAIALGGDTNVPLVLQPLGTGALQAQLNDGTATGGNARGANAVDWQMSRASASQVASGSTSFVGGGRNNTASNQDAFVGAGFQNVSSSIQATIAGGARNSVNSDFGFIGSGLLNSASGQPYASIVGGQSNTAAGYYNFIGGGFTNSGTASAAVTTQSATMNGTTAVTLSGSNASIRVGQIIIGTSIAGDTYVAAISGTSLTLSKVASGSSTSTLSFFTPHGVVVGGGNNQATGAYSFIGGGGDAGTASARNVASGDWSFVGGGKGNTASGIGAVVVGGGVGANNSVFVNTSSGFSSFVGGGIGHTASNAYSTVLGGAFNLAAGISGIVVAGRYATDRGITGNTVLNSGYNPMSGLGTSQSVVITLARETTNATPTVLCSDANAASTVNQVILPNNSAYTFRGEVVSGVTGGGNSKSWTIEGLIKRGANAAATTLVGSTVTSMYADVGAATWTIALSADTTNGGLAVTFTGQAGTTIRTVARINTVEMTF